MKKNNFLLIICVFFVLFACSLDAQRNNQIEKINGSKKAYFSIRLNEGRSIFPNIDNTSLTYVLFGVKNGKNKILGEFTYQKLGNLNIAIDTGKWDFMLIAKKENDEVLSGTIMQQNIVIGNNTLSFSLHEMGEGNGSIAVTVCMPKDTVAKVKCVLLESDTESVVDTQTLIVIDCSDDGNNSQVVYKLGSVSKGYYNLKLELYQNESDETMINGQNVLIKVDPYFESSGVVTFESISSIYTITYHYNGIDLTADYVAPSWYNSSIYTNLPNARDMSGDVLFYGWCDNKYCFGDVITAIDYGSTGNKELWAKTVASITSYEMSDFLSTKKVIDGTYTVQITDSSPDMDIIKSAMQKYPGINVNLDLSLCTELTSIKDSALSGCTGLTSVVIPNSVISIGEEAFEKCSGLTSVVIPNSVTSIKWRAFAWCSSLTGVDIPNSVTDIEEAAFLCSGLTSVVLPNSLTEIYYGVFEECESLTSVVIPNTVTAILDYAFCDCNALESIDIPSSVTSIESHAFARCVALKNIDIPNSVTSIGDYAFYNCVGLKSADIGSGVTSIGQFAFKHWDDSKIEKVNYHGTIEQWCNITIEQYGNPMYSAEQWYINDKLITNLVIPNTVTTIKDCAFEGCSSLISVEIPDSVTSIGAHAFEECSELQTIVLGTGVTSIGESGIYSCEKLETITCKATTPPECEYFVLQECPNLTKIYVPTASVDAYKNHHDWKEWSVFPYKIYGMDF